MYNLSDVYLIFICLCKGEEYEWMIYVAGVISFLGQLSIYVLLMWNFLPSRLVVFDFQSCFVIIRIYLKSPFLKLSTSELICI